MEEVISKIMLEKYSEYDGFKFSREIRDPLYGYIYITKDEKGIIDTDVFQRLDRLLQTPSAHFVYPNATHTRKAHSLGVMHLAHQSLCEILYRQCRDIQRIIHPFFTKSCVIRRDNGIDSLNLELSSEYWNRTSLIDLIATFRISALLHDIGHGPFSHIFEDVCNTLYDEGKCDYFKHEEMSKNIINEKLSEYMKCISSEDVVDILTGNKKEFSFVSSLIDGPYDVDKLDYLGRDAYHAGTYEYGNIDYERIISGFRILNDELLISSSSLGAVMNSFIAAQYMYTNVYYHKTSRIIDFMITDALKLVPTFLQEMISNLDLFISIDDQNIISEIKTRRDQDDAENNFSESYDIMKNVMNRKLKYKTIYPKMLTLSIVREMDKELSELATEIEEDFKDLSVKIDYSTKVKPIRVDPIILIEWLTSPVIFDEMTKTPKPLEDFSYAYFSSLTKSQVLFNVLVDREVIKDATKKKRVNELIQTVSDRIEDIERKDRLGRV